ncbi:MAG: ribonuclease III, partial [Clostridia bacterium]|nr:ribonuclease III [Clostridia bacterium]
LVRERQVLQSDAKLNDLQKQVSATVSAKGQSDLLEKIEEKFTEEEREIYHRGRNAKKSTKSKNASVIDYNRSTGFEAVLGYLYLTGQYERISLLTEEEEK